MTSSLEELARVPKSELTALYDAGTQPEPASLVDWEFRGYNRPFLTRVGGFQKFRKGFYRHEGAFWGYNINVVQGALERPWSSRPSDDAPRRFGFFSVRPVGPREAEGREPGSLLFNYADAKNRLLEGSFLRDYVKLVEAGNPDLLLGKAYSSIAGAELMPTWFIIQRDRPAPTPVVHPG
ncbi:MAG: hypothetical protein OZ921_01625 [Sorangiineae bacterium]|nr:hypothetical protein [Polyangiaceae bacterium]MEB2321182.1 hypothetical protein [Sorangiineae bacterium]